MSSGGGFRMMTDIMRTASRTANPMQKKRAPLQPKTGDRASEAGGYVRGRRLSQKELSIRFAKGLLTQGHHLQHKTALETLCTALGGSGPSVVRPHFTPTPLSSATLLGSFLKHRLIRNQESVTNTVIRKIVNLVDPKNALWTHSTSQLARKIQFTQSLERLGLQREALGLRLELDSDDAALRNEMQQLATAIRKTELVLENMEPTATGTLHPDALLSGDKITMTPSEAAQLPSPSGTIRGILIRIKGPRKGNRAVKQQRSAGRVSINSVGYVVADECSIQLPSKLGIYGLYIRLVYSKTDRLITPSTVLPVLEAPLFQFRHIAD